MEEEQGGRQTMVEDGYKRAPNDDAGHTGLFDLQKRCGPCSIRGSMRAWVRKGYELRRAAAGKWPSTSICSSPRGCRAPQSTRAMLGIAKLNRKQSRHGNDRVGALPIQTGQHATTLAGNQRRTPNRLRHMWPPAGVIVVVCTQFAPWGNWACWGVVRRAGDDSAGISFGVHGAAACTVG